jgi:hypothetical protein
MDFRLLGPMDVAEHDRLLDLGGVKQRSLLAVVLLPGGPAPAESRTRFSWSLTAGSR